MGGGGRGALGIGGHSRPGLPVPIDPRREGGRGAPASLLPRLVLPPYQTPMQAPSSLSMLPNSKKGHLHFLRMFCKHRPKNGHKSIATAS